MVVSGHNFIHIGSRTTGLTPPSSRFTASFALGCDGFKKDLKNNFFDYYDPDEFKTWHSEWETGLKKIREEVALCAADQSSLDDTLHRFKKVGDFMIKGVIPMMEYFDNLETAMKELFVNWALPAIPRLRKVLQRARRPYARMFTKTRRRAPPSRPSCLDSSAVSAPPWTPSSSSCTRCARGPSSDLPDDGSPAWWRPRHTR